MTDAEDDFECRLLTLETKLAYQDKLIEDLNDVVIEQRREVDDLRRRLDAFARYVQGEGGEEA
jgi:uncharacterized coiled-coil protein SlyX